MRPFCKCLILRGNHGLQIFGHFSFVQNILNIVLIISILGSERYPFALQKVPFDLAKAILLPPERIAFAKPEVKNGDFGAFFRLPQL
jgi:hypothetical protein